MLGNGYFIVCSGVLGLTSLLASLIVRYPNTPLQQYEVTDLHNRLSAIWSLIGPRMTTFNLFSYSAIMRPKSIETLDHCLRMLFGILLNPVYRHFSQICLLRPMKWPSKSLVQSKDNRDGRDTEWLAWSSWAKLAHISVQIDGDFFRIWGNFRPWEKGLSFWIPVWNFVCLLSGYLSVFLQNDRSKWPIFHGNFSHWKLEFSCFEPTAKQGKIT